MTGISRQYVAETGIVILGALQSIQSIFHYFLRVKFRANSCGDADEKAFGIVKWFIRYSWNSISIKYYKHLDLRHLLLIPILLALLRHE